MRRQQADRYGKSYHRHKPTRLQNIMGRLLLVHSSSVQQFGGTSLTYVSAPYPIILPDIKPKSKYNSWEKLVTKRTKTRSTPWNHLKTDCGFPQLVDHVAKRHHDGGDIGLDFGITDYI